MNTYLKRSFLLLLLVLYPFLNKAQVYSGIDANNHIKGAEKVKIENNKLSYVRLSKAHQIPLEQHKNWLIETFNLSQYELVLNRTEKLHQTHLCYHLYHNDIRILGAYLNAHLKGNALYSANAKSFDIPLKNTIAITWNTAIESATNYLNGAWNGNEEQLLYVPTDLNFDRADFRLVYVVEVRTNTNLQELYVDAQSGAIIAQQSLLHAIDALGTANTLYSGERAITTDLTDNQYRLREENRNIHTYSLNNLITFEEAVDIYDEDNVWDNYATDVHWATEMTYDFLQEKFNRNSLDDNGFQLRSYVNYNENWQNAAWNVAEQAMVYGDGNGTQTAPWVSLPICAHEITHGLIDFTAGLVYQGESGALNEAICDMFAYSVDRYARPESANWMIGEEVFMNDILRSMSNPKAAGDPDTYNGAYWIDPNSPEDSGGIHNNNGVLNYWFYLLHEGGEGFNDNMNYYKCNEVYSQDWAIELVYNCLVGYLGESSDFEDFEFYCIEVASELYGECYPSVGKLRDAFFAIGLNSSPQYPVVALSDTIICVLPTDMQFSMEPLIVNNDYCQINYEIYSDSNTIFTLNDDGFLFNGSEYYFHVANNIIACDGDTIWEELYFPIPVDPSLELCNVYLFPTTDTLLITECSGTIYDDGYTGPYANNTNSTVIINPTNASAISLFFDAFQLDAGYDTLSIYDDNELIGHYSSTVLAGGYLEINSNQATLVFSSNDIISNDGFEISWECLEPPSADFIVNTPNTCEGTIYFEEECNIVEEYYWDFGDGHTSDLANPMHTYEEFGNYDVSLVACNNLGCDTTFYESFIEYEDVIFYCDTTIIPASSDSLYVIDDCSGIIFDNGGPFNDQSLYANINFLIDPPGDAPVVFEVMTDLSYYGSNLSIFDGNNSSGDLLFDEEAYGGLYTSTQGEILIYYYEWDESYMGEGFFIKYHSLGSNNLPIADFSIPDTPYPLNTPLFFENLSEYGHTWLWDFGDGHTSQEKFPTHTYATSGTYEVQLTAINCKGEATAFPQTIFIQEAPNLVEDIDSICVALMVGSLLDTNFVLANEGSGDLWYHAYHDSSWISELDSSNIISNGVTQSIGLSLDATDLWEGYYESIITIAHNDPTKDSLQIPVKIEVIGLPILTNSKDTIDFGEVYVSEYKSQGFYISNAGTGVLSIEEIVTNHEDFTLNISSTELAVSEDVFVNVYFEPTQGTYYEEELTIYSELGEHKVVLIGNGLHYPEIEVSTDTIYHYMEEGEFLEFSLTLSNIGLGDLFYDAYPLSGLADSSLIEYDVYTNDSTVHSFIYNNAYDSLKVVISIMGDYDADYEYASVYFNNEFIDLIGEGEQAYTDPVSKDFLYLIESNEFENDTLFVSVVNNESVAYGVSESYHKVVVMPQYDEWLIMDNQTDTLSALSDIELLYSLDASNLEVGTYYSHIVIESNDIDEENWLIPIQLVVNSLPTPIVHFEAIESCYGMVQFVDQSLNSPLAWQWDFGDGNTSDESDPTHVFEESGTYAISLLVSNDYGTTEYMDSIVVDFDDLLIEYPEIVEVGESFDILVNIDADAYSWYLNGEALIDVPTTFEEAGTYEIVLALVDQYGCLHSESFTIDAEYPVDLEELEDIEISFYPNPNNGVFQVEYPSVMDEIEISIFNINGQQVFKQIYMNEEEMLTIDSGLTVGMYFLCFNDQYYYPIIITE